MLIFRHAVDVILHRCYSFAVVDVNISWSLNCRRCQSFAAVDVNIFVVSDRPECDDKSLNQLYHFNNKNAKRGYFCYSVALN